jgi:hypothetical protein
VSKHVRVLEDAGLLSQAREGRLHWCRFNPRALEPARASLDELRGFWERQLDGLERFLAAGNAAAPPAGRKRAAADRAAPVRSGRSGRGGP